jgi:hypothetical protein
MGLLGRLFRRSGAAPDGGLYVYLRCNGLPRRACGEPIQVRINRHTDLLEEYDEAGERVSGYAVHKDVLGTWCQNLMRLTIRYDADRRETGRDAEGATLIEAGEYERLKQEAEEIRRRDEPGDRRSHGAD